MTAPDTQAANTPVQPAGANNDALHGTIADLRAEVEQLKAEISKRESENYTLRETRRELRAKLKEAESNSVTVPEGGKIIDADEAARLGAYQNLGAVDQLREMQTELNTLRRQAIVNQAASSTNFNSTVLNTLLPQDATINFTDGEEGKVAHIAIGEEEHLLTDYAEKNWTAFLPALRQNGNTGRQAIQPATWPRQPAAAQPPRKADPREAALESKQGSQDYRSL